MKNCNTGATWINRGKYRSNESRRQWNTEGVRPGIALKSPGSGTENELMVAKEKVGGGINLEFEINRYIPLYIN